MWISLADSIHKIILIIVKIFDIKSSLPRTPTLLLQSQSFLILQLSIRYINRFRIYSLFTWSLVSLLVSIILNQFISEQFIFFPSLFTLLSRRHYRHFPSWNLPQFIFHVFTPAIHLASSVLHCCSEHTGATHTLAFVSNCLQSLYVHHPQVSYLVFSIFERK